MATSRELRQKIEAGEADGALGALYGEALDGQRRRYCEALREFERYFGPGRQVRIYSIPGRTELGGNHTDHQHGYGLGAAVNLDMVAVAAVGEDDFIRIKSRGFNKLDVVDLDEHTPQSEESTHSASLIRGIAHGFRLGGGQVRGFDAYTTSEVPRGSGLSSSAAFEVAVGTMMDDLFLGGSFGPERVAAIGHYAENHFFGKPSGQLDQLSIALGGVVFADFADPDAPRTEKIHAEHLLPEGMTLCVTETGGSHSELTEEFAAVRREMEAVAAALGRRVLGQTREADFWAQLPILRERCGDRAVLRAAHFYGENRRAAEQRDALHRGDFAAFLRLVRENGRSSFALCQNVHCGGAVREQSLAAALALTECLLGESGAWRMQGGGFAGTIQAFVPAELTGHYCAEMERVFGKGRCHRLRLREEGAVRVL